MKYTPSILFASLIVAAAAMPHELFARDGECTTTANCAAGFCCSSFGYCGEGHLYCGGAQPPAPGGAVPPPAPSGGPVPPPPSGSPPPPGTPAPPTPPTPPTPAPGGASPPPTPSGANPPAPSGTGAPSGGYPGLDEVQSRNAAAAIAEVRAEGLGKQACLAVISTALQESTLHIYANPVVPASMKFPHDIVGGDQDSIGIYQQRPPFYPDIAADMSASGSTRLFLAAMKLIPGWETMEVSALDQAVQRAEAGNLYAQRLPLANQVCAAAGF